MAYGSLPPSLPMFSLMSGALMVPLSSVEDTFVDRVQRLLTECRYGKYTQEQDVALTQCQSLKGVRLIMGFFGKAINHKGLVHQFYT